MTIKHHDEEGDGEERRALPMPILKYIYERLEANNDEIDRKLENIRASIYALNQSINSWMDKQPADLTEKCEKLIDEAIPTHPDNPDATPSEKRKEHRKAHASWIRKVDEEMDEWKKLRQRVKEWGTLGILGLIAVAVWQYLLKGPVG